MSDFAISDRSNTLSALMSFLTSCYNYSKLTKWMASTNSSSTSKPKSALWCKKCKSSAHNIADCHNDSTRSLQILILNLQRARPYIVLASHLLLSIHYVERHTYMSMRLQVRSKSQAFPVSVPFIINIKNNLSQQIRSLDS